jgi:hypothetical protein
MSLTFPTGYTPLQAKAVMKCSIFLQFAGAWRFDSCSCQPPSPAMNATANIFDVLHPYYQRHIYFLFAFLLKVSCLTSIRTAPDIKCEDSFFTLQCLSDKDYIKFLFIIIIFDLSFWYLECRYLVLSFIVSRA